MEEDLLEVARAKMKKEATVIGRGRFTWDADGEGGRGGGEEEGQDVRCLGQKTEGSGKGSGSGEGAQAWTDGESKNMSEGERHRGKSLAKEVEKLAFPSHLLSKQALDVACARNEHELERLQAIDGEEYDRLMEERDIPEWWEWLEGGNEERRGRGSTYSGREEEAAEDWAVRHAG